ncbi:MAG TPA: ArgE/DapE family deacylase [Methanocorpusculum sp.]|nr:ArgE/DapE family deacylase [Methanocorpusculum sp.]
MDVAKICSDLVKIKSENPPGNTREIAEYIVSILDRIGIKSTIIEGLQGHCNVISNVQNKPLMFSGHIDVVPAINDGWIFNPYGGQINDTYVCGRGSSDMKGGCATIITAVERAIDTFGENPVSLSFVCDEENDGKYGVKYLIKKQLIHPCDVLIAEPTPQYSPTIGQKGLLRYNIDFNGKPGHSSTYPINGDSAIIQALKFISWIDSLHKREYTQSPILDKIINQSILDMNEQNSGISDVFRHIMYNPGIIEGGERVNIVAQKCKLTMDMRLPWGCDCNDILNEINKNIPNSAKIQVTTKSNASLTDPNSDLVTHICNSIKEVYKVDPHPTVNWAASDSRCLNQAGFNAVEYGPGDVYNIHGLNEKVKIDQLRSIENVYYNLIHSYYKK